VLVTNFGIVVKVTVLTFGENNRHLIRAWTNAFYKLLWLKVGGDTPQFVLVRQAIDRAASNRAGAYQKTSGVNFWDYQSGKVIFARLLKHELKWF